MWLQGSNVIRHHVQIVNSSCVFSITLWLWEGSQLGVNLNRAQLQIHRISTCVFVSVFSIRCSRHPSARHSLRDIQLPQKRQQACYQCKCNEKKCNFNQHTCTHTQTHCQWTTVVAPLLCCAVSFHNSSNKRHRCSSDIFI